MRTILGKRGATRAAKLTAANRRALREALKAGHSPEDIMLAMDHASHDLWLMGLREGSGEKTDLPTILTIRNGGSRPLDRVEQLIAKAEPDRGFPTEMTARRQAWERHHGR
jgi:hypothetical protein